MTIKLEGSWKKGFAFDVHMLSSTYLGPDEFGHSQFDNTRSEMGELVYKLKYQKDKSALPKIVALLDKMKGLEKFDYIVPIPPTVSTRAFQPVTEIAIALGARHGVDVLTDLLKKKPGGRQLKNVNESDKPKELLSALFYIDSDILVAGCSILLVDDLYDSGATLSAATELLYDQAKVDKVCVLTMTKTRSN